MGHEAHEVDPFAAAYDPGAHGRQKSMEPLPASADARPAGQSSQLARLVAPTALEYFPPGHDMHALSPRTGLYDPAAHCVHVLTLLAPATLPNEPSGHASHDVAPRDAAYEPG